jgi:hypothetical protein
MKDTEDDRIEADSPGILDPLAFNRANFTRILWERFSDPSMSHHGATLRYGEMLARSMEWDKADPMKGKTRITIKLGECEECLKAGRDTSDRIK